MAGCRLSCCPTNITLLLKLSRELKLTLQVQPVTPKSSRQLALCPAARKPSGAGSALLQPWPKSSTPSPEKHWLNLSRILSLRKTSGYWPPLSLLPGQQPKVIISTCFTKSLSWVNISLPWWNQKTSSSGWFSKSGSKDSESLQTPRSW